MRFSAHLAWLCLIGLCIVGCAELSKPYDAAAEPPGRPPRAELETKIAQLKANNEILSARIHELTSREKTLAARLRDLQFISKKQAEQIEALAGAPLQRDFYKARTEEFQAEVQQLKLRIAKLQQAVESLRRAAGKTTE